MYALHGGLAFGGFGGLPDTTHCALLPLITSHLPIMDEIAKCMVAFAQTCLLSDCKLVSFVTRYVIWVGRMSSPVGANVYHCVTLGVGCRTLTVFCILRRLPLASVFGTSYPLY